MPATESHHQEPSPYRKRKGQTLILEEVMMFALGILIIIGMIFIFDEINNGILEFVEKGEAEEVNSYIKSHIMSLKNMDCTKCHITIKIPEYIGGKEYTIYGEENKKKILIHNNGQLWNEKNVSVEVIGLSRGSSMLRLEYYNGLVMIRGVSDY